MSEREDRIDWLERDYAMAQEANTRLRIRVEALEGALTAIANDTDMFGQHPSSTVHDFARAALAGEPDLRLHTTAEREAEPRGYDEPPTTCPTCGKKAGEPGGRILGEPNPDNWDDPTGPTDMGPCPWPEHSEVDPPNE